MARTKLRVLIFRKGESEERLGSAGTGGMDAREVNWPEELVLQKNILAFLAFRQGATEVRIAERSHGELDHDASMVRHLSQRAGYNESSILFVD